MTTNADHPFALYGGSDWQEPSIGDTTIYINHELMWDGGQWKHSPDCHDDPPEGIDA